MTTRVGIERKFSSIFLPDIHGIISENRVLSSAQCRNHYLDAFGAPYKSVNIDLDSSMV